MGENTQDSAPLAFDDLITLASDKGPYQAKTSTNKLKYVLTTDKGLIYNVLADKAAGCPLEMGASYYVKGNGLPLKDNPGKVTRWVNEICRNTGEPPKDFKKDVTPVTGSGKPGPTPVQTHNEPLNQENLYSFRDHQILWAQATNLGMEYFLGNGKEVKTSVGSDFDHFVDSMHDFLVRKQTKGKSLSTEPKEDERQPGEDDIPF